MQELDVSNLFSRALLRPRCGDCAPCNDFEEEEIAITYQTVDAKPIIYAEPLLSVLMKNTESGLQILQAEDYQDYVLRKCVKNLRRYNNTTAIEGLVFTRTCSQSLKIPFRTLTIPLF